MKIFKVKLNCITNRRYYKMKQIKFTKKMTQYLNYKFKIQYNGIKYGYPNCCIIHFWYYRICLYDKHKKNVLSYIPQNCSGYILCPNCYKLAIKLDNIGDVFKNLYLRKSKKN